MLLKYKMYKIKEIFYSMNKFCGKFKQDAKLFFINKDNYLP